MGYDIFVVANNVYNSGMVILKNSKIGMAQFFVDGETILVTSGERGLRFQCGCQAHQKRFLQDKLCRRVIATMVFISRRKEQISHSLVGMAVRKAVPWKIYIKQVIGKKVYLDIGGKTIIYEKTPQGSRVRYEREETGEKYYDEDLLASVLYIYLHKGKLRK